MGFDEHYELLVAQFEIVPSGRIDETTILFQQTDAIGRLDMMRGGEADDTFGTLHFFDEAERAQQLGFALEQGVERSIAGEDALGMGLAA